MHMLEILVGLSDTINHAVRLIGYGNFLRYVDRTIELPPPIWVFRRVDDPASLQSSDKSGIRRRGISGRPIKVLPNLKRALSSLRSSL